VSFAICDSMQEQSVCWQISILLFSYLLGASKETGLEVNTEKTEYMFMCYQQIAEQNHNIKIINH
jgi:hypothetical protein